MGELDRKRYDVDLRKLRGEERSKLAARAWQRSLSGASLTKISEELGASNLAIKTLLEEYASAESMTRAVQRGVSIGIYQRSVEMLLEQWQHGIQTGSLSPKSMNMTKIPDSIATLQGRIDKLTGVEAPTVSVSADATTLKDLLYSATDDPQVDPEDVYDVSVEEEAVEEAEIVAED